MFNTLPANDIYKPNVFYNKKDRKCIQGMMVNQTFDKPDISWVGDLTYISYNLKRMHAKRVSSPMIATKNNWPGKLEKIKELVVSGRYKINAEKIAEKMLGSVVGFVMTR